MVIRKTTLYNSYTGMSPAERSAVVRFLCEHTPNASRKAISEALDYALKHKPSFGGFVLTIQEEEEIVGAVVVNRTGMEEYNPNNIVVYLSMHKDLFKREDLLQQLLQEAIHFANDDIALHVEPGHPALKIYKKLGFQEQYIELRLNKKTAFTA